MSLHEHGKGRFVFLVDKAIEQVAIAAFARRLHGRKLANVGKDAVEHALGHGSAPAEGRCRRRSIVVAEETTGAPVANFGEVLGRTRLAFSVRKRPHERQTPSREGYGGDTGSSS